MSVTLRPDQQQVEQQLYYAWAARAVDVMVQAATGWGKTVLFSKVIRDHQGAAISIAHRKELVTQMSLTLARNGVRHRVIAPANVVRECSAIHLAELGYNYVDPNAPKMVAGVDKLVGMDPRDKLFAQVTLVVLDEAHHVLKANKWGKARAMFPNARGMLVTATPCRADGKGLGRASDGVADVLIQAPSMREVINAGNLTEYRVFVPPNDIKLDDVETGSTGDFNQVQVRRAVHRSNKIVGDVVSHYLKIAPGKLGVTFAVDVDAATEIAKAFRDAGVPAEVVSADTPAALRTAILRRFRNREILQLVNVDLFGEGFDLPAIEVVSMARPTQSFALYAQQFGRALRLMVGKQFGIIIDHVGNVIRHGLPDAAREWSLDPREKRGSGQPIDAIPLRACLACTKAYARYLVQCPHCGDRPEPAGRSSPKLVDGDLYELDAATLAQMRGEIDRIREAAKINPHGDPRIAGAIARTHWERQQAQAALVKAMQVFGGYMTYEKGHSIQEAQRRFYHEFGVDVGTAQTYGRPDAEALLIKVNAYLSKHGIDAAVNAT